MKRRDLLALGLASASAAALRPLPSFAQGKYPDRPIKLIVPFAAGGVVDLIARLWSEQMKTHLGTVVIENQGGGGGTLGAGEVARAAPDGYTLLLGNTSTLVINPIVMPKVPYDPVKDFAALSVVAISATCVVVTGSLQVSTLKEFVAYAKANAPKLSYGSAGAGTLTNLAGEMFKQQIGAPEIVHVPYKGAGPGISDLVSGHVPFMTPNVTGQLLDLHRTGKVKILAVLAPTRLKGAPDIPTAAELGMPALNAQLFNALFAPAATPKPVVDQVADATRKALSDPAFQDALIKAGFEPVIDSSPEKAKAFVDSEHQRLIPVIKAAGLKVG